MFPKTGYKGLCFKDDFLRWFMRGGGALCAESEAWGKLEKYFGPIYVPHQADEEIMRILYEQAKDSDAGFLLVLIGMPGSGKTLLLKELINGPKKNHFSSNCWTLIETISKAFEFRDVMDLLSSDERKKKGDYPTSKRVIWVTTAVDDFVDTSVEAEECLKDLEKKLNLGLGYGESLLIFGNRGVLGDVTDKTSSVIHGIADIVEARNRRFHFVRVPRKTDVFWIKQFGIEEPLFNLTSGPEGFKQYSKMLIKLSNTCLLECARKKLTPQCKDCIADVFQRYILELMNMLDDADFAARVHSLLFYLWLKHCDLYLTPRSLNLFWGYCLHNMWNFVGQTMPTDTEEDVARSIIYDAIYLSRLPSIRGPEEYPLSETGVCKYRDEKFESEILSKYAGSLFNRDRRRRERLKLFFAKENLKHHMMIAGGSFQEYSDSELLLSQMDQILWKLVLRRFMPLANSRSIRAISRRWSPQKLLFASIVELVERKKEQEKKRKRLLATMFDNKLFRDVAYHGFKVIEDRVRYLELREKVLELDVRVGKRPIRSSPRFNVGLDDYEVLRDFISKTGEPSLLSSPQLRRKISAFVRCLNGIASYFTAPLLYEYLKERKARNDAVGLFVYALKGGKDCNLDIRDRKLLINFNAEKYTIDLGENS